MTRFLARRGRLFTLIAVLSAACGGSSAPKVPLAAAASDSSASKVEAAHALLGPEAKAALDSGNALFRKKAYAEALVKYRLASELAPQHAAPLFGIQMVGQATNNKRLADSAIAEIQKRNGPLTPTSAGAAAHSMSDSALKALRAQMKKGVKPGV